MISGVPSGIRDNFRFLLAEVMAQVTDLRTAFESGSPELARKVLDRSGYPDNLKMRIRDSCMAAVKNSKEGAVRSLSIRGVESVAVDLERIARLCRHCVRQLETISGRKRRKHRRHATMLKMVEEGLQAAGKAAGSTDIGVALKLSKLKEKIDRDYARLLKASNADLKRSDDTEPILAGIFMGQRITDMGGALQDIGDAVISANMGQQLSSDSYRSLAVAVDRLRDNGKSNDITVEPLAQTRSGSGISGISEAGADADSYIAVFKDGKRRKLKEERNKVDIWNSIFPGMAPKVLAYQKNQQSAALLLEHLPGQTLEQILLFENTDMLLAALKQLKRTLRTVWTKTHVKTPVPAAYMEQLSKRMTTVYKIHRDFGERRSSIAGHAVPSFDDLIAACDVREKKLKSPYTVRIHGDFNLDNILYDADAKSIRFIDLHRSQSMDFVQDVSVLMVSLYRLQALDAVHRRRVHFVAADFYDFARSFAAKAGDRTFELRLALGLARSFATSTRFILDKSLADRMFQRARFLLEQVDASPRGKPDKFTVPVKELFIG